MTQTIRTKKLKEGEIVPITFDYVLLMSILKCTKKGI